jgi:hypothetical protein
MEVAFHAYLYPRRALGLRSPSSKLRTGSPSDGRLAAPRRRTIIEEWGAR